jgi:hypothetical protein
MYTYLTLHRVAYGAAHLETVDLRHRPIKDRQMWGSRPADLAQGLLTIDHTGHRVAPATQGGVEPMARHWVVFRDKHAKTLSRRTELMYRHISGIGQKSDDLNY